MAKFAGMTLRPDEIIPPDKADDLAALEARQAAEWQVLQQVEALAKTMDAQFKIPMIPFPIGLDAIIGLIPGIGDTIGLGVSGYIVVRAARLGIGSHILLRMVFNIFIDWLIGLVPIIGDIFDIGWRGNMRNAALLSGALETRWAKERQDLLSR
jgi:hypothetical protein